MARIVLTLFLIGHVLGDFYLRAPKPVKSEKELTKRLWWHSLIYLFSILVVIIPIFSLNLLKWAFIISIIHFMIGLIKLIMKKKIMIKEQLEVWGYFADQTIHILAIMFITMTIYIFCEPISYIYPIQYILDRINVDVINVLSWILVLLIIIQPFSITIKKVLYGYKPTIDKKEEGHPNAGALIGVLERCIILLLLSAGQYSAIGFVLTAKSIARYNKIVEDPQFSEYYLLGTLLSVMLVIVAHVVIF